VKLPEEKEGLISSYTQPFIDIHGILEKFPEIEINNAFLEEGISLAVFSVRKDRINHVPEITSGIIARKLLRNIKFLLFLDSAVDIHSPSDVAWIAANNIDPLRDCFRPVSPEGKSYPVLVIDGTRKISGVDGFEREWPNVIVMDEDTMKKVDEKWEKYGLGPLLPSLSRKYRSLILNDGAIVHKGF
jgi:4-hydroxy-3-polyprenylbenzoate decarboxylase